MFTVRYIFRLQICYLLSGNYVVQQVFVCGDEAHKVAILDTLTRDNSLLKFSKHKYASNVVETVLMHGNPIHKEKILQEILKVSTFFYVSFRISRGSSALLIFSSLLIGIGHKGGRWRILLCHRIIKELYCQLCG